jgi:Protein of unknown function (DUF3768)
MPELSDISSREEDMDATKVRELNDAFRTSFMGGQIMLTNGVTSLPTKTSAAVIDGVKTFQTFTKGNDPNAEHDFGSITIGDETFFWKIDYYDLSLEFGSPDPSDPTVTTRVLTIMCADEY